MTNREKDMTKYGVVPDGSARPGTRGLLTRVEEQRRTLVRRAMVPMPCPYCHTPVDHYAANPAFSVDQDTPSYKTEFACPNCHHYLRLVVPFNGTDFWTLVVEKGRPLKKEEGRSVMDLTNLKYSEKQIVLPRKTPGVDYGAEYLVLVQQGLKELWWIKGHTYWSSRMDPSAYYPPELELAEYKSERRSRMDFSRKLRLFHGRARLSRALLEQYSHQIDDFFRVKGLTQYVHPRKTILLDPPEETR